MDWTQFLLLFAALIGMMYTVRSDAKDDRRRSAGDRKEIIDMMRNSEQEAKEFHGRLCTLEERYLQMMERFITRNKE